jgi:ferredoxin--NADP+ reductase
LIENGTRIDLVVAVGPIMIDGTGMCGGCRVLIDGKSEFACVDGPEFDGHKVNFEVLVQRNTMYRTAEQQSMEEFKRLQTGEAEEGAVCAATSGARQGAQR